MLGGGARGRRGGAGPRPPLQLSLPTSRPEFASQCRPLIVISRLSTALVAVSFVATAGALGCHGGGPPRLLSGWVISPTQHGLRQETYGGSVFGGALGRHRGDVASPRSTATTGWRRKRPPATCEISLAAAAMLESVRLAEYRRRNHTWPIRRYLPDTPGWRSLLARRFDQLSTVSDLRDRYNGWISSVTSASVIQNYTETGWAVTRAPPDLVRALQEELRSGLAENRTRLEHPIEIIRDTGPDDASGGDDDSGGGEDPASILRPLFIDQPPGLADRVLRDLRPLHESFTTNNVPLVGEIAYGFRLYRNRSSLLMHTDKPDTHVIASILHVDRSDDAEPWPLVIEDYHGGTTEVVMERGDMVLYESAKVYHGRPRPFDGSWYCSIFTHYYPVGWDVEDQHWESHYAVPPHWWHGRGDGPQGGKDDGHVEMPSPKPNGGTTDSGGGAAKEDDRQWLGIERLQVVGTGLREPDAVDGWSALGDAPRWSGPAKEGVFITRRQDGGWREEKTGLTEAER